MTSRRAAINVLLQVGAAIDVLGDAWAEWLKVYEEAQDEALARGGLPAVRELADRIGLDIIVDGIRDRMLAAGLEPVLEHRDLTDRVEDVRRPRLVRCESETIQ